MLKLIFLIFFRSVLSRAELDALPLDNNLKEDVERGKVITTCLNKYVWSCIVAIDRCKNIAIYWPMFCHFE